MGLLNKLTIKNLKLNKKRTIVTIIGIILSVALITAVSSMYASGIKSLIQFETHEKGDFHAVFYDVDFNDIGIFKNNRNIEKIKITKDIGYAKINSKNEYKPYVFIKAFTKNSLDNLAVNIVEGRLPLNEDEIVIPTHLKTNGRVFYQVGDEITLDIGKRVSGDGYELKQSNPYHDYVDEENSEDNITEEIIDTKSHTYKIVGIMERPDSSVEPYSAPGYTLITYLNSDKINGKIDIFVKYNDKSVKNAYNITANILGVDEGIFRRAFSSDLSEEEIKKLDEAKYEYNLNTYLIKLQTNPIGESNVAGLGIVVFIVIIIIIFTSVFCIRNSFDISITEKTKQYGMLRSIGATKKQVKKNVFYEATILGLIGIPLGILSGILAAFILIIVSNYFIGDLFGLGMKLVFAFSFKSILVAFILGSITIYLSAFKSARKASLVSPIDSIRNSANIKIKNNKLTCPKIIKKVFGIGGEISYKNIKRNKKKYRTTVFSLVISVFVFIALSGFMNTAFDTIKDELEVTEYNISLYSRNVTDYEKYEELINLDNIDDFVLLRWCNFYVKDTKLSKDYIDWRNIDYKSEDQYFRIVSLGSYQYKKYIERLGLNYDEIKDKGILVDYMKVYSATDKNNVKSKNMRVSAYNELDTIKGLTNGDGGEDNKDYDYHISIGKVTDIKPFGLKYSNELLIVVSDELFNTMSVRDDLIEAYFKSSNADKLQDDIDSFLTGEVYSLNNVDENFKMMNNLYTLLGIFLYGFIIVISLIGITNIFNTITTNVELRKPEFAMLRSIGMTNIEFNRMIRLESLFIGFKALLYGIPIGVLLSFFIVLALADGEDLSFTPPYVAIIISIVVVFILIFVIMNYSINKISKQNTIETIRNENI